MRASPQGGGFQISGHLILPRPVSELHDVFGGNQRQWQKPFESLMDYPDQQLTVKFLMLGTGVFIIKYYVCIVK